MTVSKSAKYQTAKLQGHLVKIQRRENSFTRYLLLDFCKVTQWELELLGLSSIQEPGDPKSFSCQSNYRVKHRFVLSTCQPWIKLNFTFWGAAAFLESTRQLCYHPQPEAANYFCSSPLVPGAGSDMTPALYNRQSNLCPIKIPTPAHKRLRT